MAWSDDNKWESDWWGNCANTYGEETKQIVYAKKMGLVPEWDYGHYPVYDLKGAGILDIGGGPVSLLLKCSNLGASAVVDPCQYPGWVADRYQESKIGYYVTPAENMFDLAAFQPAVVFDEVWIYNVLQHVVDPELIIKNARQVAKIIRLFEWIDIPVTVGHPHVLTEENLNKWLGGQGKVELLNESGCNGKAYFGIFKGDCYAGGLL